jgi:biopolymer transport protein ExbD
MATLTTASTSGRKRLPAIDMTPMVDLAFLLLTFFVLTTTLTKPLVLQMVMPDKVSDPITKTPVKAERVLTLVLDANNKIHWYPGVNIDLVKTTDFSKGGIRKVLLDKKSAIKNLYVVIKPSDKSQYKNMVDILDEMILTEISQYAIVDLEIADKDLIAKSNKLL